MWLLASLRLINGHNSCFGRVEVVYNGIWGTVCDNGWDLSDAAAVCREMGCGDVIEAKSSAHFGQGSGPVWISDLQCSDTDSRLRGCKSSGWGRGTCGHEKDAGVICKGECKPFNNNVRLVNSTNSCYGRVEVLRSGQWGTVCDDGWDASDAAVVCRQLGCGTVLEVKNAAYFGKGSGPIWMNNINCFGNEATLMSCSYNATPNRCDHEKDAGVICEASSVRLVDGSSSCSGRVQVFHDGIWGTVCYNGWDLLDANVVCSELGCGEAKEVKLAEYFGKSSGQIWLTKVKCFGNESSLTECPVGEADKWGQNMCLLDKYAGVICQSETRLVSGINSCSGRVQVLYNGTWGTVCDDGWDLSEAAVVCREIGCGDAIEVKSSAYFGEGSGQIWMDNVNCSGNESALSKCEYHELELNDCNHSEDVGVICQCKSV
uniref:Soluble scavenger receptor cysteine-rich domain-containing protein SSC5D n=1 Tax=Sinocyclocheilus anshuiensis TaxID=1608454 RepID=A0A671TCL8_9TELE